MKRLLWSMVSLATKLRHDIAENIVAARQDKFLPLHQMG